MEGSQESRTNWSTEATVDGFAEVDGALWWRIGYRAVPELLKVRPVGRGPRTVLDLGCGDGTVANWVAEQHGVQVIGVDPSAPMIHRARQHAVPGTRFVQAAGERTGLRAGSVEAAWAAFVMVCLPDLASLRGVVAELGRVVRPGGRVVLLDSHPETTGVDFGDVVQGEPGVTYRSGDRLPVWLRRGDETWFEVMDTYWSLRTYVEVLTAAGFSDIEQHAPLLGDRAGEAVSDQQRSRWRAAEQHPPFVLVSARRGPHSAG